MLLNEIKNEVAYLESLVLEGTNFQYVLDKGALLLNEPEVQQIPELRTSIILLLINVHYYLGNTQQAKTLCEIIFNTMTSIEHRYHYAKGLIALANIHKSESEFAKAIELCLQAEEIFVLENNTNGLASTYTNIAIMYRLLADYKKSLEYMDKARRLYEELGNELGVAANTGNIGNVYFTMRNYTKALEYLSHALHIHESSNDLRGIANNCLSIGGVYLLTKDNELAESYFQRALENFILLNDKSGASHVQSNLGILFEYLGKYKESYEIHVQVLEYSKEIQDPMSIAIQYGNLGHLFKNQDNPNYDPIRAEDYILKALEIHTQLQTRQEESSNHKSLSELYEQTQHWEKALIHLKRFNELQAELLSEETKHKAELLDQQRKADVIEREKLMQLARYKEQERMLHSILPSTIADRILDGEQHIVDSAKDISIFFSDIMDFTSMTSSMSPELLIQDLNSLFTEFDRIAKNHGIEKIKTIGDSYMAVCGVPQKREDHAVRIAEFALEILSASQTFSIGTFPVHLRIGLHAGDAIAGIIGEDKYSYDLWGDAVNIASRMENTSEKGKIHITEYFKNLIEFHPHFQCISRGILDIKGKGPMKTYFLDHSNNS
ncbi:MAG: adenylate/guanylate cyclase domain-containing protein [Ignavibacteria bacterium]